MRHKANRHSQNLGTVRGDAYADKLLEEWYAKVQERDYKSEVAVRVNGMVLRNALHLAWITGKKLITPEMIENTIKLGEWRISNGGFSQSFE